MKFVGLLLAAGLGQRFDPTGARLKLLEPAVLGAHAGAPIAVAAARTVRAVLSVVHAVVRPPLSPTQQQLHALLIAEGCRLIVCENADQGMGASLACGVRATAGAEGWIVALADMPAVRATTIAKVLGALETGAITAAPRFGGQRGHPVGFSRVCYEELAALQGDQGARSVLRAHPPTVIEVSDPGCLLDIDTPAP
ncbi:MAG: nucleotidyltransferase family protein [Gemmatimonadota bacterium]